MSFQNGLYSLNCHIVEKFRLGVIMMGLVGLVGQGG